MKKWLGIRRLTFLPPAKSNFLSISIIVTDVEEDALSIPTEYRLEQNYPNPFNPSTIISFQLPEFSKVTLKIYDLLGREAAILVNEEKPAGYYKISFDASKLSSGVYFYRMITGDHIQSKKMIVLK